MGSNDVQQMVTKQCACGAIVSANAKFCEHCGNKLQTRRCRCGNELSPSALFCSACGERTEPMVSPSMQSVSSSKFIEPEGSKNDDARPLVSVAPWEESVATSDLQGISQAPSSVLGSSFSQAIKPKPAPVIGHWKLTQLTAGTKGEDPFMRVKLLGGTGSMEKEYVFTDNGLVSGLMRLHAKTPPMTPLGGGFVFDLTCEENGSWEYLNNLQQLTVTSAAVSHVDNFEMGEGTLGDEYSQLFGGMSPQDEFRRGVEMAFSQQNGITSKQVFRIERGNEQYFEARNGEGALWRFDRLE